MFCYESSLNGFYEPRRASPDGCNIDDDKTLNNLLRVSTFYRPDPKYLETKQENCFTESMRSQLTEWMFGVSAYCSQFMLIKFGERFYYRYCFSLSQFSKLSRVDDGH